MKNITSGLIFIIGFVIAGGYIYFSHEPIVGNSGLTIQPEVPLWLESVLWGTVFGSILSVVSGLFFRKKTNGK